MLFVWIGFLKPDAEPVARSLDERITDFLSQPFIKIRAAGPLRDGDGQRAAMMMMFEHGSRDAAEAFVNSSPFLTGGVYQDHRLYEYGNEIG